MLKLYPEQLHAQLNKKLSSAYFLVGNDPFFLRESYDEIRRTATSSYGFNEHHTFQINDTTDWKIIFSLCRTMSLFSTRQTIQLLFPEKNPSININKQLKKLVNLLHDNILLIVRSSKLTEFHKSSSWFNFLSPHSVQVICCTPKQENLASWVLRCARKYDLQLNNEACRLLCYFYEGNLLALSQVLEKLSILYPNTKVTLPHVRKIATDSSHFSPIHWIDALLAAKSKRSLHILQQLRFKDIEPIMLIRTLQRELFLLLKLQRESEKIPLSVLLDKYLVWKNRRVMITKALDRLTGIQIRRAIYLLTRIELEIKRDYYQLVWNELESLSLLLCNKALSDVFIYG